MLESTQPVEESARKIYSLLDLLGSVQRCIDQFYSRSYYVTGEISGYRGVNQRGHCYFDLIDKPTSSSGGDIMARVSAVIWNRRFGAIVQAFEAAMGQGLREGLRILAEVEVNFSPRYGLQLTILDIDPTYTLGEVARQRRETLAILARQGLLERNRELPLARPLRRIAVISSPTAAGYQDFMQHLAESPVGRFIYTTLFPALLQGEQAISSVVDALHLVEQHCDLFDLVVIIRGGGSVVDLGVFDQLPVAQTIALLPLPVWSGIGHQRDQSVVDIVSHRSFKTPTAVAEALLNVWLDEWQALLTLQSKLGEVALQRKEESIRLLDRLYLILREGARDQLSSAKQRLFRYQGELTTCTQMTLQGSRVQISQSKSRLSDLISSYPQRYQAAFEQVRQSFIHVFIRSLTSQLFELQRCELSLLDHRRQILDHHHCLIHAQSLLDNLHPDRVLARGYAILRKGGHAVFNADRLTEGDRVEITLATGVLQVTLQELSNSPEI